MLVAVVLSAVVATTLLATGPVLATALAEAGLRARLEQAPPAEIGVAVEVRTSAALADEAAAAAAEAIAVSLGDLVAVPDVFVRSTTLGVRGTPDDVVLVAGTIGTASVAAVDGRPREEPRPLLEQPDADGLPARADAARADGVVPVLLHEGAQRRLGVAVGDELDVEQGPTVRVVGTLAAVDPAEPRWWDDPLWRDGVAVGESFSTVGPVVPVDASLAVVAAEDDPRVAVVVRVLPRVDQLLPGQLAELRDRAGDVEREASRRLRDVVDATADRWTVRTPLAAAALDTTVRLGSTRASVLATVAQVAVLALYTLGLAGRLLRSGREVETMLVRARGATPGQLGGAAVVEGLVVVVPVLVVAPWLAARATAALGRLDVVTGAGLVLEPRVSVASFVAAAVAAVACLALLVWPAVTAARRTYAATRGARGRRRVVTVVQATGLDLALVVVAGIGIWQLRTAGSPVVGGTLADPGSVDVVLVTAPALGLLAGALLVLRLVPVAARLGERAVAGTRGLVGSLSGWQVARRPDAVARPTLLLVLAVAIGVLVATYARTWDVSQEDQAAAAVGADVVAVADTSANALSPSATASTLAAVDGVDGVAPAIVAPLRLPGGTRGGTLVAFAAAEPLLLTREDVAPTVPLTAMDVPPVAGFALPEGATLRTVAALDEDPEWPGLGAAVAVLVRDGDGLVHRLDELPVPVGTRTELTWDLTPLRPPVAVVGWEVVASSGAADGAGSRLVPEGTTDPEVLARLPSPRVALTLDPPDVDGTRLSLSDDAWVADDPAQAGVPVQPPEGGDTAVVADGVVVEATTGLAPPTARRVVLRVVAAGSVRETVGTASTAVPGVVHPDVLEDSGRAVGDVLEMTLRGVRLPVEVVGTVDVVPGAVDEPLPVMVDLDAVVTARWEQLRVPTRASEWHLDVGGDAAGSGATALDASRTLAARIGGGDVRAPSVETTVIDAAVRSDDPIAIGLVVALALGALAAVLLALLGTLTAAAVGVRERAPEFALLQAVGTSMRQIRWWLAWEVAVVVVTGLVAGVLLGGALVWAVLPTLGLAADGSLAVPAPRVVVPVRALLVGTVVVVGAFALVPLGLARTVARAHVAEVLRLGGDG